ncbi:MAG TPA: FtsX-like permease family protein, partial [Pyrinomonadaceae bacterium]|nr:FtsX-like permease family protein [Pyrinomonadaceae bacterium]
FPGEKYVLQPSQNRSRNQIILNEWAARDLGAHENDSISLEYFVWQDDGQLATRSEKFTVAAIVSISGAAADRNLVPEYPGISESESMSDWDPPFPVDLERIRKQDEDYWKQYRTTPKAFIRLEDGQKLWQSRFGKFTSIRLMPDASLPLDQAVSNFGGKLRQSLNPATMGLVMIPVREQGLAASRGATDFGEYFLYFSFFLVISALLLTSLFFKLGIEQRVREIGVLEAVGFPAERIRFVFLIEGLLLSVIGSLAGLIGAVVYGQLMMFGLRTWWVDAVGTTSLQLHVSMVSLILGAGGGVVAAVLCVFWTLRKLKRLSTRSLLFGSITESPRSKDARGRSGRSRYGLAVILTSVGLLLLAGASLHLINQTAGFFGGGTVFLIALLCYVSGLLKKPSVKPIEGAGFTSLSRLGFRNTTYRAGRSVLCIALIASATFIIVAVDAFRRDNQKGTQDRKSGSGGYPLMAESLLPLIHDPNSAAGREAMNLSGDTNVGVLNGVQFARFRLRAGDDASCLNLYQPHNPRILGASDEFIRSNRFAFQNSLPGSKEENENPWLMLDRSLGEGPGVKASASPPLPLGEGLGVRALVIPVIADANSLTYVLHLKLGDEFVLNRSEGSLRLRIVGALAGSIFQSELIMSENNFKKVFPHEEGHRFFLIATPENQQAAVSAVLEDRLSDFGFDVVPTGERLASFHRVENTYLSTFQMLGGLGLLLGTLGMAAVLLRNILERRRELALLRAVGYNSAHFTLMITAENALLLCTGLAIGVVAASLAITPVLISRGGRPFNLSLGVLLVAVLISGLSASIVATWSALRSPILPPLRAE